MLRWADPPDDVRVDNPPFDRRQVLLAWHSKCDNAIAQGWIGNREFHTARIGSPRRVWLIAMEIVFVTPWDVPAFVVTHHVPEGWPRPGSTVQFVTDGIESAVARAFDHLANTPVVLGNPTVVAGVGVTHLRYPVHTS
jgi:hypothetical protein